MIACLKPALHLPPCAIDTPEADLCDPCARMRRFGAALDTVREDAYLSGYAQGWADARCGHPHYGDLDGLAEFLRVHVTG